MDDDDIASLFAAAAVHAARFRQMDHDRLQRPSDDYISSVRAFAEELPRIGIPIHDLLEELCAKAEPGLHMPTGPRFYGWVMGGSHPVGVAADFLTSAWGQNAANHVVAPSAAAVETVAAKWLLELLDLPAESSVGFVTGATMANFTCLAAARSKLLLEAGWDGDALGLFRAPPITVLIGDDAHTTVFSALQYLGLGHERIVRVPTDAEGRIKKTEFQHALAVAASPCLVILQAGQINTGAFDDFQSLVPIAKNYGAWVHIDGAFGLWARASQQKRHLAAGAESADSWATDGHKWLQTPYDSGYAIVRAEDAHRRAMSITASYLPTATSHERDPSHYVPELSRRARGFATWAMIKYFGKTGVASLIEQSCEAAGEIASLLAAEPGINVLNDVRLNQIVVKFGEGRSSAARDDLTAKVISAIQDRGEIFAGGARWKGDTVMRISVSNFMTDHNHAERTAKSIIKTFRALTDAQS